ncbi:hypothetical protein Q5H93_12330 [Hymenobacter sp. ASUV-10]|uniref:Uncharacterized protein n=1 Tax=Hymenobacter aranciens TaxID=3063996 RepID=A0ABT9BBF3_9BACT|nr:hypothetical protein [Hymenobacter sp. ASUV-10]MDO7875522.1 hypothetical protein [Hymenobacter sp. ASUV-10]
MIRPDSLKRRINYRKTWSRVVGLFKNPASIRPDALPAELAAQLLPRSLQLPRLKGNVFQTLKEIVTILLAEWRDAPAELSLAIRTTRTSLAKRCGNLDPKTAYRHILCLIHHGFLRAKIQIKGGLQLLLNPELFVFEEPAVPSKSRPAAAPAVSVAAPVSTTAAPANPLAALRNLARGLAQNFTQELRPTS